MHRDIGEGWLCVMVPQRLLAFFQSSVEAEGALISLLPQVKIRHR